MKDTKDTKLTVVDGGNNAEFIQHKSDELLNALLVNNDRKEAEDIIKNLTSRGKLGLVSKQQAKDE